MASSINKRGFMKRVGGTIVGAGLAAGAGGATATISRRKLPFVLVHGAWHGAWCYERIIPMLAARGHFSMASDLPAHGRNARFPASYFVRPLNQEAWAKEISPVAATTLEDNTDSIIRTIDAVRALGFEKVILLGHSMGGVSITKVAELVPEKIAKLVYLTAFMPAIGLPGAFYVEQPENRGELVGPQFPSHPMVTGALRIDQRSADPVYRANTKLAFYGDLSQAEFEGVANLMIPDVPAQPFGTAFNTTPARWGALPRHYIKCSRDRALRPLLQQRFINEANGFVPHNPTKVHELDSDHSPFLTQPVALANLLASIAVARDRGADA